MHAHVATWKLSVFELLGGSRRHAPRRMLPVETFDGPAEAWRALSHRILDRVTAGRVVVRHDVGPPEWAHAVSDAASDVPSIVVTFPRMRFHGGKPFVERARIWQCDCGDHATRVDEGDER
jgi:hypothetical protein